jgi:SAM-dependent methyltransferase
MFTPARRRGTEYLDDATLDPAIATRSLRDVARANTLFGGCRAVLAELEAHVREAARRGERALTLLDVGTGLGDIPRAARALAARHGVSLRTIGLEMTAALAHAARPQAHTAVAGDARTLPFADRSIALVTCSQVLHHLDGDDARALLAELSRVAQRGVIVSDLRRSWLAAGLLWCVSFPLGFHPVSRHDGVTSIFRGFTRDELAHAVHDATGVAPSVRHRLGWRVTARWSHT